MPEVRQKSDTLVPVSAPEGAKVQTKFNNDPYVIGATALILGYALGSRRWNWLSREVGSVLADLGSWTMIQIREAVRRKNAEYLSKASQKTPA
jgi:hypothetical protein